MKAGQRKGFKGVGAFGTAQEDHASLEFRGWIPLAPSGDKACGPQGLDAEHRARLPSSGSGTRETVGEKVRQVKAE